MTAVVGLTESGGGYKLKNTETNTVIDQSKISVEDGQLRVVLSGVLDLVALTRDLRENSYFVANDPPDIDSQGWGEEQDMEDYYPY